MKPVDLSRANFAELKNHFTEQRAEVHRAWLAHGPGTTRDVAAKSGLDLLTLRPRSTELYQLGLLEFQGRTGHDGLYRARTLEEWETYLAGIRQPASGQQMLSV
jgi:hypothetical protein